MSIPFDPAAGDQSIPAQWRFDPIPPVPLASLGIPELPELVLPEDNTAELERIKAGSYTGYDPDHLCTATVDGTGVVSRIRLATTIGSRSPETVEKAICAAIGAAMSALGAERQRLTERIVPYEIPPEYQRLLAEHGYAIEPEEEVSGNA